MRGYTVSGIFIIDEASSISDDIFDITSPYTNVNKSPKLIISTPKFKRGRFYEEFTNGLNTIFDWALYDTSRYLSEEDKELARLKVTKTIFTQDYLGLFAELMGSVFGDFSLCVSDDIDEDSPIKTMGIDWGTGSGSDYTAICIMNAKKQVVCLDFFNDKDSTNTINRIAELYNLYKPENIVVEQNSIGSVYKDLLKKKLNKTIHSFVTTNDSKNKIINKLQVAFQNKDIQIPNIPELLNELTIYEQQLTPTNKPTFNAISGGHDDLIIALALAYDALTKFKISVM